MQRPQQADEQSADLCVKWGGFVQGGIRERINGGERFVEWFGAILFLVRGGWIAVEDLWSKHFVCGFEENC